MIPGSGGGTGSPQVVKAAAHRKPRGRSPVARVIAAGGAVICIGAAYEVTAPTVHALSVVFRTPDGNGHANEVRVNLFQGNIFDPQLGILGANVSNNSTTGGGAFSTPNNPLVNNILFNNPVTRLVNAVLNAQFVIGGAASGPVNNSMQISFGSFNIFNPQSSLFGGNLSNNTTGTNFAVGNGNNSAASATSVPSFWNSFFGMTGNGNVMQFAFFSGNIFNPQFSIFGPNVSNNTAETNVAANNGNYSQTTGPQGGGLLGAVVRLFLGGMTGNGNTSQTAVGTSNIGNPQVSLGGSNQSNNTAVTNNSEGNGNNSQTSTGGGIVTGTTGNGNTNQTAVGSSNIGNTQVSVGDIGLSTRPDQLSASQSNAQLTSTSTTPTTSSAKAPDSSTSNSTSSVTSGTTGTAGTSTTESGGSPTGFTTTSGSGATGTTGGTGTTSGTSGTPGTGGTSGTSGAGASKESGGAGGSGDSGSGGSGGSGSG